MNPDGTPKVPSADTEGVWIRAILERKRKQTDREIREFTAEKEKDYIAFERRLRAGGQYDRPVSFSPKDVANSSKRPHEDRETQGLPGLKEKGDGYTIEGLASLSHANGLHRSPGTSEFSREVEMGSDGYRDNDQQVELKDGGRSMLEKVVDLRNREVEFQGLFTPSYLPLLDSSTHGQEITSRKPPLTISVKPDMLTTPMHDSKPVLSSSATLATSTIGSMSPPATRQFSASVPKEGSLEHRRSSSRSDTSSASLRSSLRDPKQPRSPKRVLFSIDDVVVAPSTSPAFRRTKSSRKLRSFVVSNVSQGFENTAAGTHRDDTYSREQGIRTYFDPLNNNNNPPQIGPVEGREYTSGPSHTSLDIITSSSPPTTGDDFERVNYDDDLFTFDEDMGLGELEHADGGKAGDAGVGFGSDDEDDEVSGGKAAVVEPSSSPHAGSLPIEIRWPAKPDPRE